MLKSDKGNVTISGNIIDICADLTCLIHNIYEDVLQQETNMHEEDARKMIMDIVDTALKPIEEVQRENAKKMAEASGFDKKVINLLEAMRKRL